MRTTRARKIRLLIGLTAAGTLLAACGDYSNIPLELLTEYRKAMPHEDDLRARPPEATLKYVSELGDPAVFPGHAVPIASTINDTMSRMVRMVRTIILDMKPGQFNWDTREFVWGPFDNTDSPLANDQVYVYMKKSSPDSGHDFRFHYDFIRTMNDDPGTAASVIRGWSNPDPSQDDHYNGLIIWDFEANRTFEERHAPGNGTPRQGCFVVLYGTNAVQEQPNTTAHFVVAIFRDFVPKNNPLATPVDLDYLWGSVQTPDERFDFLDIEYEADIENTSSTAYESVGLRLAFYNTGMGRAEVLASGGDIATDMPGYHIKGVECWNSGIARTYLSLSWVPDNSNTDQTVIPFANEGMPWNCAFDSLAWVPSLDDVPADLRLAMERVAQDGIL